MGFLQFLIIHLWDSSIGAPFLLEISCTFACTNEIHRTAGAGGDQGNGTRRRAKGVEVADIDRRRCGVTNGNGAKSGAKKIVDLSVTVCNKSGVMKTKAKMEDVKIIPNNKFNLFSVTKRQKAGWILSGNDKHITLTKDGV